MAGETSVADKPEILDRELTASRIIFLLVWAFRQDLDLTNAIRRRPDIARVFMFKKLDALDGQLGDPDEREQTIKFAKALINGENLSGPQEGADNHIFAERLNRIGDGMNSIMPSSKKLAEIMQSRIHQANVLEHQANVLKYQAGLDAGNIALKSAREKYQSRESTSKRDGAAFALAGLLQRDRQRQYVEVALQA